MGNVAIRQNPKATMPFKLPIDLGIYKSSKADFVFHTPETQHLLGFCVTKLHFSCATKANTTFGWLSCQPSASQAVHLRRTALNREMPLFSCAGS